MFRETVVGLWLISIMLPSQMIYGDVPTVELIKEKIQDAKGETGHLPGHDEMVRLLLTHRDTLEKKESQAIWSQWREMQNPMITRSELYDFAKAQRDSVYDLKMRYNTDLFMKNQENVFDQIENKSIHFAFSGDKLYSHVQQKSENGDLKDQIRSYDGEFERTANFSNPNEIIGIVQGLGKRSNYYNVALSPLTSAMLWDSTTNSGMGKWFPYDLVSFLDGTGDGAGVYILEKPVSVDGVDAVVVAIGEPATYKIMLDPDRNFSVLKFESYSVKGGFDHWPSERYLAEVRVNNDWVEQETGVWLPRKVILQRFDQQGNTTLRGVVDVSEIGINQNIGDDFFTDIFPMHTQVWDSTKNIVYEIGSEGERIGAKIFDKGPIEIEGVGASSQEDFLVEEVTQYSDDITVLDDGLNEDQGYWVYWLLIVVLGVLGGMVVFYKKKTRVR